ncbi:MAG TPA: hydroxypyruvate isomerase [Propionibacteriaceae bacterium]|nr:hydroxypyruvate isomerase [Propionibacteriaceae bacterium]HBY22169.1 hydroxypyruvate isomerase [Propionibacteriaceae bacterium]
MKYAVNCTLLFTELPLLERPAAAKAAGFDAVEFWWPWSVAVPTDDEVDAFVAAIRDAGVQLIALNLFAGDIPAGERGLVSVPSRAAEFRANVPVAMRIGAELGCRAFNALYGNRDDRVDPAEADDCALDNLVFAARAAEEIGATILLEPLSAAPAYPLLTAADVSAAVQRVRARGVPNVRFLCDLYHLAANGDDVAAVCRDRGADVAHCQIADVPGRGEPGSGRLPLTELLATLRAGGYDGWVSLEYKPTVPTAESFGHLPVLSEG